MRRLVLPLLFLALAVPAGTLTAQGVPVSADQSLAGTREIGLFVTGRILSTFYSVDDARSALGGAVSLASHINSHVAIQGGLGVAYGRQDYTYYRPPLVTFTPTLSLILQGSTANDIQPYVLAGGGYEFIRYTKPRCDCNQSRSLGIGNVGVGVRKMVGERRAFRFEATSQIGSGGPAFTIAMGLSLFVGHTPTVMRIGPKPPDRVRPEPPVVTPRTTPPSPPPAPPSMQTPPQQAPARVIPQTLPEPAPNLAGTILLTIDGTQVDFNKTSWRDDAEPLLDGVAVDLTSDAGEKIKINIEAHTDNIGSRPGNIAIALDRAKAVREFLINQGVSADRITVSSSGGDAPIAPNNTALGRQRNRRIVIRRTN
jgi:outer membrane protein OmpA-like peptidoglycan-associated protein